jgi:hypothetical protein
MMAAAVLWMSALLAQPFNLGGAGVDAGPAETIEVVAFHALDTGALHVDEALRPFAALLERLPQDTFRLVHADSAEAPMEQETSIRINDDYAVHVIPLGHDEEQQLQLQARVTLHRGGQVINALVAEGKTRPGRALLLHGLEMPEGMLGIVLRVKQKPGESSPDSGDSQEDGDQQNQQQPQSGDNEPGEEQPPSDQSGESEQEDAESDSDAANQGDADDSEQGEEGESGADQPEDGDAEEMEDGGGEEGPKDMENVEALLKSLEEQDRREQRSARNRRDTIRINKEWW